MRVFDFELDDEDMTTLDALTTPEALAKYVEVCDPPVAPPHVCLFLPLDPLPPALQHMCTHAFFWLSQLYAKCVMRDTPDAGRTELVRTKLTMD